MSRILRRPMFRGGGVSSYGTGITSGLADGGRVGLKDGTVPSWAQNADVRGYKTGSNLLSDNIPTFSRTDIMNFIKNNPGGLNSKMFNQEGLIEDEDGNLIVSNSRMTNPELRPLEVSEINSPTEQFGSGFDVQASEIKQVGPRNELIETDQTDFEKVYRDMLTSPMDFDFTQSAAESQKEKDLIDKGSITQIINESMIPEVNAADSAEAAANNPGEIITLNNSAEDEVTTLGEGDLESMISRYEDLLGMKEAKGQKYSNMALRLAAAKGDTTMEKLQNWFGSEEKAEDETTKVKQAAAMLGIKGEQAQKLYETKLKNTKGMFTKKVEEIMSSKGVDRATAVNMSLNLPANLDAALIVYKQKNGMPPTPEDFDTIARAQGITRLPEDPTGLTGKFYIPGEQAIVVYEEGVFNKAKSQSYKAK